MHRMFNCPNLYNHNVNSGTRTRQELRSCSDDNSDSSSGLFGATELTNLLSDEDTVREWSHRSPCQSFEGEPIFGNLLNVQEIDPLAVVIDVKPNFGRLLIMHNVCNPDLVIYFDRRTELDGISLKNCTDLRDEIQPGMMCDICVQVASGETNSTGQIESGILLCTGMVRYDPNTAAAHIFAYDNRMQPSIDSTLREVDIRIERINPTNGIGIATTIDSDERVLLHSHAFPNERLFDVISSVTIDPSMYLKPPWEEYIKDNSSIARVGYVLKAQTIVAPVWLRDCGNCFDKFSRIAISVWQIPNQSLYEPLTNYDADDDDGMAEFLI